MKRKSLEQLLLSEARGEPMDVDDRRLLDVAPENSGNFDSDLRAQRGLSAELKALRNELRPLRLPVDQEHALRTAFRAARRDRSSRAPLAVRPGLAAALAVAVAAGVTIATLGLRTPSPESATDVEEAVPVGALDSFQPLVYGRRISPAESYSIVRVRLPVSSLGMGQGYDDGSTIEASLLLGEDGLAHAISFDQVTFLNSSTY